MSASERRTGRESAVCPVCGMWQSDAETDPEERAIINARFAGKKSGEVDGLNRAIQEACRQRDELRVMLKRLLGVALVDGYGETVRDEAEAMLRGEEA